MMNRYTSDLDVPLSVRQRRRIWHVAFMLWLCIHCSLLVAISGGSASVASKVINNYWRDILALTVAICSALLATLQPQQVRYRIVRCGSASITL
jgi:membrane protein YdbS with pleckstrin-like domain